MTYQSAMSTGIRIAGAFQRRLSRNTTTYTVSIPVSRDNFVLTQSPALGVVFLEIGLWQTVTEIKGVNLAATIKNSKEGQAPREVYEKLIRQAEGRLGHRCGERFRDITMKCLEGKTGDLGVGFLHQDELATELQGRYQSAVVEPLALLAEAV